MPSSIADNAKDFYLRESEALKSDISETRKEIWGLERLAVGATGAVWAWLAVHNNVTQLAWSLPVLFAILGSVRCKALSVSIAHANDYLQLFEADATGREGWETYKHRRGAAGIRRSHYVFWITLLLVSIGVGVLGGMGYLVSVGGESPVLSG